MEGPARRAARSLRPPWWWAARWPSRRSSLVFGHGDVRTRCARRSSERRRETIRTPLLILRQRGDEAYVVLRAANRISRGLHRARQRFLAWSIFLFFEAIAAVAVVGADFIAFLMVSLVVSGPVYHGPEWPFYVLLWGLGIVIGLIVVVGI